MNVPELPYLAPWYRLARVDGKVLLEWGQRVVTLQGRAAQRFVPALLPLLDGTRTFEEVVAVLGQATRPAVERVLAMLTEHGVLVDGPPLDPEVPGPVAGTTTLLAALRPAGRAVAETAEALSRCTAAVAGGAPVAAEVARLLRASGVAVERAEAPTPGVDLTICAPAAYELQLLAGWNEQALRTVLPWLQLLPFDGRYAAVGPLYLPAETCCYECFRRRRAANLEGADELALLEGAPASYPAAPAVDALAAAVAAQIALGWLVLGDHYAPAAMYAIELVPSISVAVHHVHRVPRCPACSDVADVAPPLPWHKEIPVAGAARA
jgi:bacteriocin biosynthesis cyclodehydratase domain-containing protein